MSVESTFPHFANLGQSFTAESCKKLAIIPFKDHLQFPLLIDILSRKENHHAVLYTDYTHPLRLAFLQAFSLHLADHHTPPLLRTAEIIHLDMSHLFHAKDQLTEEDFLNVEAFLETHSHYLIFAITHFDLLLKESNQLRNHFLRMQFDRLLSHPNCRFLIFSPQKSKTLSNLSTHQFTSVSLLNPTETDIMTLLKLERVALEHFHQVVIPEELLSQAHFLAGRYLSTHHTLEKTMLLLDSSAARASVSPHDHQQIKPVLTTTTLMQVLSAWTHIPVSHLHLGKFKLAEFMQNMRGHLHGQESAITLIGQELQQARLHVEKHTGPFCHFMFAGPLHVGKKTAALGLVDHLFKQLSTHFVADFAIAKDNILDLPIMRTTDHQYSLLKEVILQMPFAVILFDNIELATPQQLSQLSELITTGRLQDTNSAHHYFHQSTIIFCTALGSDRLIELANRLAVEEEQSVDLFQLILNETKSNTHIEKLSVSPQEIVDLIRPDIINHLPAALCQHIVPFLPLSTVAIEKIIQQKLKVLGKQLDARYSIELSYAPEVIRYLAKLHVVNVENTLKQLYFSVEQAISSQGDIKHASNQLFLQLDETGELLRCDWIAQDSVLRTFV